MKKRTVSQKKDGFTLIITILLLSMLTVLAIGMLSLGAITLRGGSVAESKRTANANAQLALMLAIGELQKNLGSDQRVTADAALLKTSGSTDPDAKPDPQSKMVGVWESYNPYSDTSVPAGSQTAPTYDAAMKDNRFKKWLVSHPTPSAVAKPEYGTGDGPTDGALLFSEDFDGFQVKAEEVPIQTSDSTTASGAYAWAMVQENTKAKINTGGDSDRLTGNDAVQAPSRPNVAMNNKFITQPSDKWVDRNAKVISFPQAQLDNEYKIEKGTLKDISPDYTATAQGVLADVVKGRLKTDLSLGFELPDNSFKQAKWGDIDNPFAQGTNPLRETPLYTPATGNTGSPITFQPLYDKIKYDDFFYIGSPPTFATLRSYYQQYQHLYNSGSGATAFERNQASTYWTGNGQAAPRGTETGVSPIVDRIFMVFSIYVTPSNQAAIVMSPVITLWNPYNVAIDAPGFVAYPCTDLPNSIAWTETGPDAKSFPNTYMSQYAGLNQLGDNGGRQQAPYFYCQMTNDGTDSTSTPIHLEAGEVRVFTPTPAPPVLFKRSDAQNLQLEANRVVRMRPVQTGSDLTVKGGIAYPCTEVMSPATPNVGLPVGPANSLAVKISFDIGTYRYGVSLENEYRIVNHYKLSKPSAARTETQARYINQIQVFTNSGQGADSISSASYPASRLKNQPQIVGAVDTYHRTSTPAKGQSPVSDMVYSVNPRQRYIFPNLGPTTSFTNGSGPHYDTHMISGTDFSGLQFQTTAPDGRNSFYGKTNDSQFGKDHLSWFDIPREPQMSLGAFQHADLTDVVSSPANQFGNSWASPYVEKNLVAKSYRQSLDGTKYGPSLAVYDTSYLTNSALWDGYYFSSLAPKGISRNSVSLPTVGVYDQPQIKTSQTTSQVIDAWLAHPQTNPLRNPRYVLHQGSMSTDDLKAALLDPKGCRDISAHLMVDGAFNVNSTSVKAWEAVLGSLKGEQFSYQGPSTSGTFKDNSLSPFPRERYPAAPAVESGGNMWQGFRALSDSDIEALAKNIVTEVKSRGPFQSMSEFVNRRLAGTGTIALRGAIQAAIDATSINSGARLGKYATGSWRTLASNINDPDVGTGLPGWLTQADILTGLGPFITVRSDTFTVRAYGEARDTDNNITARSWCEATVQRMPEFLDTKNDAGVDLTAQTTLNTQFGRRFEITAFRWISPDEIIPAPTT